MKPKILIASTTWWALPARVAMAFSKAGAEVSGVVPKGSPLAKVSSVKKLLRYSPVDPLRSLSQALLAVQPDLIIPCDDRVVEHLHQLHTRNNTLQSGADICSIIAKSLGAAESFSVTGSRGSLLQFAAGLGIRIPDTGIVQKLEDLSAWLKQNGYPAVLKVDGTWGGTGVRIVRSWEEATGAFQQLTHALPISEMLRLMSDHDFFPIFAEKSIRGPEITIQKYIEGESANIMFACWEGKVLDSLSVKTLFSVDQLGSSTIVRTMRNAEMQDAGEKLVKSLSISGFCGLDFIIEAKSGCGFLIELNPRATQIGHLEPGGSNSLVNILFKAIVGETLRPNHFSEETVALFPHILRCRPEAVPSFPNMIQDVPWSEPELTRELMKKSWNRRHFSSFLYSVGRRLIDPPKESSAA